MSSTRRPWTQPIGFQHALFEVAIDALRHAKTLEPKGILDAIVATDYASIVGPVKWTGQPVKNVTKTPLVAIVEGVNLTSGCKRTRKGTARR